LNPKDGEFFNAKRNVIIPNGLEDMAEHYSAVTKNGHAVIRLLYVGVLQETKGVLMLLRAVRILTDKGLRVHLDLLGEFNSPDFEIACRNYCRDESIEDLVNFAGVQKDTAKWFFFRQADIFCFPSFFESESFGNVVVEAMMFELPVIGTNWRGIPDIVRHEQTGILIETKNAVALADSIGKLIGDSNLRTSMGKAGRKVYEENYKIDRFLSSMELELKSVI
jgi:glycosyltransferase involved in cell wall biosynthesis